MRLQLILPRVVPPETEVPTIGPYKGCDGTRDTPAIAPGCAVHLSKTPLGRHRALPQTECPRLRSFQCSKEGENIPRPCLSTDSGVSFLRKTGRAREYEEDQNDH